MEIEDEDAGARRHGRRRLPVGELSTLLQVSAALAGSLDLPVVLQTAVESACEVLRLDTGAIYLLDDESMYLGATTPPLPPEFPEEYRQARLPDHPHIRESVSTGAPVHVRDTGSATLSPAERGVAEARGLVSILYLPLLVENRPVGTIIVGSTGEVRTFDEADIDLCRTLSYQIALAVANARLFESVKRTSAEIARINTHLEDLVQDRTEQLASANEELTAQQEELRAQADELELRSEQLAEANEVKSAFLRSMSHELRTPLNSIIGFSDILMRGMAGPVNGEQHRQLEMIGRSGNHLLALINQVLDLSRIEAGAVQVLVEPVDLCAAALECVESMRPAADAKGLTLTCDAGGEHPVLTTDAVMFRQILVNLLGNAVKFTESGGVTVSMSRPTAGFVAITVRDTGIGIPSEEQDAVFGDFRRGRGGHEATSEGTGLGLAISRGLAEALGGTLAVVSTVGEGSAFTLLLPESSKD